MRERAVRVLFAVAGGCALGPFAPLPSYASPLNKTVDFTFTVCVPSLGQCNPPVHVHNYISSSGNVFAYKNAAGGSRNALGTAFMSNGATGRFTLEGDSLVLDSVMSQGSTSMTLRVLVTFYGKGCSLSGGATLNGDSLPIQIKSGPCRVYEGHKDL